MTQNASSIPTISINEALYGAAQYFGNEMMLMDDISWNELVQTPTQIGFLFIALCTEGEASFSVNGNVQYMKKGDLLISFGNQVFDEQHIDENFHGKAVLMSRTFAQNCIVGLNKMWPYLIYLMEHPVLELSAEEQSWIIDCYHLINRRLNKRSGRYMREATESLVRAFYFEICNLLDARVQPTSQSQTQTRAYTIFDQFIRLVSAHYKNERSVEWYSSEMCLTPKHLSEVVKQVSGRTAGQWITTLVIIEIKSMLTNTSLSIKEITDEMNFPNQSFLGKYFKNVEGISPTDFRRNMPR